MIKDTRLASSLIIWNVQIIVFRSPSAVCSNKLMFCPIMQSKLIIKTLAYPIQKLLIRPAANLKNKCTWNVFEFILSVPPDVVMVSVLPRSEGYWVCKAVKFWQSKKHEMQQVCEFLMDLAWEFKWKISK